MKKSIIVLSILVGGLFSTNLLEAKSFAQNDTNNTVMNQTIQLNQEDAHQLLLNNNSDLTYIFQGTENQFDTLNEKGLEGYVFLPDIDTDLGYFVDKNTSNIYYFHPSGYLELIK
jgi:hypothetical protein